MNENILEYIVNMKNKRKQLFFPYNILFPYYNTIFELLEDSVLNLKYASNIVFYITIFAYFTKLNRLFLVMLPLNLVNFISITLVFLLDSDKLLYKTMGNKKFKKLSFETKKTIIDNDEDNLFIYKILNILYHLFYCILVLYLYYNSNSILNTSINYLGNIQINLFIILIYWLIGDKIYGDINENFYISIYILLLIIVNYYLFSSNN